MSDAGAITAEGFLIGREWRDGSSGVEITLWAASDEGPIEALFRGEEAVMFVPRGTTIDAPRREPVALRALSGSDVDALYYRSQRAMLHARDELRASVRVALESDVKPHDRFLMERFVTAGIAFYGPCRRARGVRTFGEPRVRPSKAWPRLSTLALDLETDDFDGPILSAAIVGEGHDRVWIVGPHASEHDIEFVPDERALLLALFRAIAEIDPDVITGWNVVEFDLTVLQARCAKLGVSFALGRKGLKARILEGGPSQPSLARIPGRVALDGIATMRSATYSFERWTLEHVAREVVGRGKAITETRDAVAEIRRMYREDPRALATYNREDCRLVLDVIAKTDLVAFAMQRAELTGLPLDRQGGSVAAFDHLYLPRLHRRGFVAPDIGVEAAFAPSPGGHVLESVPGLHTNVLSFDFRSLYPSIVRTFQIDPLGLALGSILEPKDDDVRGDGGARFARDASAILPSIVTSLHERRSEARARGDEPLSRAIKILMNSFYGVLGTPGCRFFDPRLASSITRRGHEILERSQRWLEARALRVLYGDTDSLFVAVDPSWDAARTRAEGTRIASELTAWWVETIRREHELESFLELRFDVCFERFLMPTMRGSERGSKKRYAGLVRKKSGETELVVRGLEVVRTDWCPLARRFQRELLIRVLEGRPHEAWIREIRNELFAGRLDHELVYRRRLRRELSEYESAPPHVQVARMLEEAGESADAVEYVMTTRGPEAITQRASPIDHTHYLEKQLAPAADVVLPFLGTDFARIAGTQMSLF